MVESNEVLRDFLRWCNVCKATVQVEKWTADNTTELVCRRCGRTIAEGEE